MSAPVVRPPEPDATGWSDEYLALGDGSPQANGWNEMPGGFTGGGSGEDDVPDDPTQAEMWI